ncbi:Rv3235 family protein [Amycolatopsis sp.]|uniref:Rv3235 family protein n=1 Tax=Amycolatopsis sp. TaxID=37632 RepID=UPI002BACFA7D|nr:Rv3235 family protein [Amycolatopsis sp.]HVV10895.1 Rv3235 family protein [Amycolatopsis sp.]
MLSTAALKPLRGYEPLRDLHRFTEIGGQLVLDLMPAQDSLSLVPPGPGELTAGHVRAVLKAILEAHTGRRPVSQLQGLVHPRLYRRLTVSNQLKGVRFALNRVRISPVGPDAYEVSGAAGAASRTFGLMARFELGEPGWRCTYFDLVLPARNRG